MTYKASDPASRLPWIGLATLLAAGCALQPRMAAVALAAAAAAVVWRWPAVAMEVAAFAVCAVRPSLDMFSARGVSIGPLAASPAVVFGLGVLWFGALLGLDRARRGHPWWLERSLRTPHVWLLVAYLAAGAAGTQQYGSVGMVNALRELLRYASVMAGLLVILWWTDTNATAIRRGWWYLGIGGIVPIAVALSQYETGRGFLETEGFNRLQGTFSHPNSFGTYLVPFILVTVGGLARSALRGGMLRVAIALFLTFLVVQTYSRTALLALGSGLVLLAMLHLRNLDLQQLLRGAFGFVLVAVVGWLTFGDYVRERFTGLDVSGAAIVAATEGVSENSFHWRLINWWVLIGLGLEHPLAGHGAGMTSVLNPIVNSDNGVPFNAHNDFVRFFFEGGVLGLTCYLVYAGLLSWWAIRLARDAPPDRRPAACAVAASLVAVLFTTLGAPEFSLQTAVQYTVYAMLALTAASAARIPASRREVYKSATGLPPP